MSDVTDRLTAKRVASVREGVLAFFDAHRRNLPWRHSTDPYRVWVSEIMLQQTRVETVRPYYDRWIERFPTLEQLADADIDDVLLLWQGLGYYSRARNLHRAAREVRERHGGDLPGDRDTLLSLPGIGRYTAGAIASIAFRNAVPAVDGNVRRVLHRLLDEGDIAPATLEALAARLVPTDRPGDFNQGLMELGSTVCTPRSPSCGACPIHEACLSRRNGTQALRPTPKRAPDVPQYDVGTAVLRAGNRVLLVRRPDSGRLAGMWEFPGVTVRPSENPRAAARRAAREVAGIPLARRGGHFIGAFPHAFSHRKETYHVWRFDVPLPRDSAGSRWVAPAAMETVALPAAQRRIADVAAPID